MTDKRELQRSLRTDLSPSLRVRASRARHRARRIARVPGLLLGGRIEEPVFVIGAPRSGTSLLFRVLAASSQLAHPPGEAHEIWERDHHPALRGWGSNVLTAEDATPDATAAIRRRFYLAAGGKRLLDKTPRNCFRIGFIDVLFPDARYVFLQRDGRENVNSLITAWRTARYRTYRLPTPHAIPGVPDPEWWKFVLYPGWRDDLEGPLEVVAAKQWIASNQHALRGLGQIPESRRSTIRYEDLVTDPVDEVRKIASFLGVDFDKRLGDASAAVERTPINIVTPPERGKWRRENPREIERISPLIADMMAALGYAFP